ncbi:MAG: single-stranded DNA-binding protein [Candidatus Staskawiczbacteria bacterium]|nr:single-stranded DNA-binding protein [Candidatus Staskawiczbacteria bacterium]
MNLNKVFVLGNVTRDPEMRALPSGQQVASFGIATNRFYTDQAGQKKQEAEFHNIVAFGKLADIVSRYLTKGSLVLIEGRIKTSNWQGSDGVKKFKTEIIAETLQLGPRPSGAGQTGTSAGQYSKPYSAPANSAPKVEEIPIIEENAPVNFTSEEPQGSQEEEGEIDVKDIPF